MTKSWVSNVRVPLALLFSHAQSVYHTIKMTCWEVYRFPRLEEGFKESCCGRKYLSSGACIQLNGRTLRARFHASL